MTDLKPYIVEYKLRSGGTAAMEIMAASPQNAANLMHAIEPSTRGLEVLRVMQMSIKDYFDLSYVDKDE